MAKIGLIDADLFYGKRRPNGKMFPNLCLMKISAYHKARGDEVGMYMGFEQYDRVYISKIFADTPPVTDVIQANEVLYGGSGYCIHLDKITQREYWQEPDDPNYMSRLPDEIEHIMPDYSLYGIEDTAYGFLSRGCPRGCFFCHVAAKEGRKSYKVADLSEFWNGQKNICLSDPNILACRQWEDLLTQLAESKAYVDFNQGLDARLLTPPKIELLNRVKKRCIHFAWDDYKQKDAVLRGLRMYAEYTTLTPHSHNAEVYVLVNFDTTREQDLERIYTLRELNYVPYVMIYDKEHCDSFYKRLQRWVNDRFIFHACKDFNDYKIIPKNNEYSTKTLFD